MSENIKVTVVSNDEKSNMVLEGQKQHSIIMAHDSSMTIMSTLLKNNLISGSFCGGRGVCGRCKIQFLQGVTTPTAMERSAIEPEELRQGYRLACLAKPKDDCVIRLALLDAPEIAIVSYMMDVTENTDQYSQPKLQTEKHKSVVTESVTDTVQSVNIPDWSNDRVTDVIINKETNVMINKETGVMIAVDLGTTTIAMQLAEMDTGRIIDTYCEMNPQRRYGPDVLSRIQSSCDGNRDVLQALVLEVLERGVSRFRKENAAVKCMCIAGNTTMEHLLMGYDVSSLGRSPFMPVEIGLQEYRHPAWDFVVWLTPGISAFVGGDIVAGLYARGMLAKQFPGQFAGQEKHVRQSKSANRAMPSLFIDLGTNGEMAITDGTQMIVTATAAGPAFEGGAGAGIIGSDMVACTAQLLRQGILDETGLLKEPFFAEGVSVQIEGEANYRFDPGRNGQPFYITKEDVRSLQMAKAAVRAGVEVLLRKMEEKRTNNIQCDGAQLGTQQIERVYLAGGFGYYLDVEAAFRIGLLPEHMRGHVQAVGNTSLKGAYQIGRDLWQHRLDGQTLEQSLSSIDSINLAREEEFEILYIRYLNFST